jgi:hypothetical protein
MWRSRGYLPHFGSSDVTQHVTFHLADSLPQSALLRWEAELKALPTKKRDAERRKHVDAWIDAGHGSCILRNPAIAAMVQASLVYFDSQRYHLLAWVVMPNHVHALCIRRTDGRSRRSWRHGRSLQREKSANINGTAVPSLALPFGTANMGPVYP